MKRSVVRFVLLLFALSVTGLSSNAQRDKKDIPEDGFSGKIALRPRFFWGASGSVGLSSVLFNPRVSTSGFTCLGGGLVFRMQTEKFAAMQVELNYARRGWKEDYRDQPGHSYSRTIDFVEMPFLASLFIDLSRWRLFLHLGPQVGYCLSDKSASSGDSFTPAQLLRHSLPIEHRFAWGVLGGPGISFYLGPKAGSLALETRFYYGFNDLFPNGPLHPYGKSSEIYGLAKLTYLLPLGRN